MLDSSAANRLMFDLLHAAEPGPPPPAADAMPPPQAGGAHFDFYSAFPHSDFYGEYWYFNFTSGDVAGTVAFGAFDPRGLGGRGTVSVVLHRPGQARDFTEIDSYPMSGVQAAVDRTDVRIDTNRVWAEEDGIHLEGRTRRGNLQFSLQYRPLDVPLLVSNMSPGPGPWEWNCWIIQMPAARVQGQIVVDGAVLVIDGVGYHDHSWGIWLLPARIWAWGVCALPDQEFNCMLGYKTAFERSTVYVRYKDIRYRFDVSDDTDPHMQWQAGPAERLSPWLLWPYPASVSVQGEGNGMRFQASWQVTSTGLFVPPSPMALFEQRALVTLSLEQRTAQGGWAEVVSVLDVPGHAEFVSRWYHPTPPGSLDVHHG